MAELSPMMKQYFEIKKQYEDSILFFRLGDFYEMFFEDAKTASKELDLVLTGRDCGQEERAPMCGVPYHSCEAYIARLVEKGYRVAICEQMEDPATAKGIVKRDIVRVVTPGTIIEDSMLDESRNNYLAVLCLQKGEAGLCFVDASTGSLHLTEIGGEDMAQRIVNELGRFTPSEVLVNGEMGALAEVSAFIRDKLGCRLDIRPDREFDSAPSKQIILEHFKTTSLASLELSEQSAATSALGAALAYLYETRRSGLSAVNTIDHYTDSQYMHLDLSARRNLELLETMRGKDRKGSLLWVLDRTKTAMGKRKIRGWIEQPLLHPAQIEKRLNAVEELTSSALLRGEIGELLAGIHDIERLMTRIVYGTASPRELKSLSYTLSFLPSLKNLLKDCGSAMLSGVRDDIDTMDDVYNLIEAAIVDEPPVSARDGGIIRPGYHAEADALRADMTDGRGVIAKVEADEKERTGIKTLKVGYNKVFGYYIEVTNPYKDQVPPEYIRKQTLTNCERYITEELKQLESRVLGAKERIVQLEFELFDAVRNQIASQLERIQRTASAIARLDVLYSFAEVAVSQSYCRPRITTDSRLQIESGRHPVVEKMLSSPFVPNDTLLDGGENRCAIITGPNMAGKSTYMRQVALITLMAQIGSFVPAASAEIGVVDAIFTRVGASDDLSAGQSTFMVEMSEVASILKNATSKSLLILDEIGRGTSTFDGMSIARAVLEHAADPHKLGAKTLFATHYHELTVLEDQMPGVKNYNIAVKKRGDDITFLRRIVRGGADDSYGIEVAKLAGIPDGVIHRAKQILAKLEQGETVSLRRAAKQSELPEPAQMSFGGGEAAALAKELKALDVNTLTPIEAMQLLYQFADRAKKL